MENLKAKLALAIMILGLSAGASAGPITVGADWTQFTFGGVGSDFTGQPFTFTLAGAGVLQVTDAFNSGDVFEIFDAVLGSLGQTSTPSLGFNIGSDYDAALASTDFSSRSFALGTGSYSITGIAIASPFGGGGAALRVAEVPSPAPLALLGLGLAGLGWKRRKQK